jgi:hypothetical protein
MDATDPGTKAALVQKRQNVPQIQTASVVAERC